MLDKGANLKLFKTFIHSFMKFSPHGAEIHRLFNDFIVLLNLISSNSINKMDKKGQIHGMKRNFWPNTNLIWVNWFCKYFMGISPKTEK